MTTTVLVALLALAVLAAGVLIGRYYVPDDRALKRTASHSEGYMRALEHLLRRDDQAAIDELRAVVADNVTALEPYFALASLFRSRGEWERAVRVHQAIAVRKDSSRADKLRARYELGLDFRAAGMPRRATRAMEEALQGDPRHLGALRALCGLYEEQARYREAAEIWGRLGKLTDEHSAREPHLWAAAAQQAAEVQDHDEARAAIKNARKHGDENPHVWTASADALAARGDAKAAAESLRVALALAPDWAIYLVPGLLEAHLDTGMIESGAVASVDADARYRAAAETTAADLDALIEDVGDNAFLLLAVGELRSHYDAESALVDFRRVAELFPELLPARVASARLALASGDASDIRSELIALVGPEGALSWATRGAWRCEHCTSRHEQFFWRCGECRQWGRAALDVGAQMAERPRRESRDRRARSRSLWSEEQRALPVSTVQDSAIAAASAPSAEAAASGLFRRARGWLRGTLGR